MNEADQTLAELSTLRHERNAFPYDVFPSHSAKDNAVVRASSRSASNGEGRGEVSKFRSGGAVVTGRAFQIRNSELGIPRLCISASTFGSEWAQLLTRPQPSPLNPQPICAPLNQERRFIPLRLDDAPVKGSLAQFL